MRGFGRIAALFRSLQVDSRVTTLERKIVALEALLERAQRCEFANGEELDMFKSRVDVSDELIADFHRWKQENAIPAEPLVSIVVATYNRSRLLTERCLPSLLGQTYPRLEVVVVGDGCTDDTEERVSRIRDPRLRFMNLATHGVASNDRVAQWMAGGVLAGMQARDMARGDYLAELDDDDEALPERIERLVAFAIQEQADFVWHPFWTQDDAGNWMLCPCPQFARGQVTTSSIFYRRWFTHLRPDPNLHRLREPGDWNRLRRIKYIGPVAVRYPEPLVRHYRETFRTDVAGAGWRAQAKDA